MSTPRGVNQVRSPDPTAKQIERRSAAIRRRWPAIEREKRRVEKIEPLVLTPMSWFAVTGMPDPEGDRCLV